MHQECDKMHVKCSSCKEDIRGDFSKHTCPALEHVPCARCNDAGFCAPWGDSDRDVDDLTRCNECDFWTKRFKKDSGSSGVMPNPGEVQENNRPPTPEPARSCRCGGGCEPQPEPCDWCLMYHKPGACEGITVEEPMQAKVDFSLVQEQLDALKELASVLCQKCHGMGEVRTGQWAGGVRLDVNDHGGVHEIVHECDACSGTGKRATLERAEADRLSEMWHQQEEFMELLVEKRGFPEYPLDLSKKDSQVFVKGIAYDAMGELFEAIQELRNSKKHRATEIKELDRDKLIEEIVDAQHFFYEVCILMGVTPEEFYDAYMSKGEKNVKRIGENY